jgi:hypothetical protein
MVFDYRKGKKKGALGANRVVQCAHTTQYMVGERPSVGFPSLQSNIGAKLDAYKSLYMTSSSNRNATPASAALYIASTRMLITDS